MRYKQILESVSAAFPLRALRGLAPCHPFIDHHSNNGNGDAIPGTSPLAKGSHSCVQSPLAFGKALEGRSKK